MPRSAAACRIGRTKSGKRLSAMTMSTSATSAAGSRGRASPSLSPRRVATSFSPVASIMIPETEIEPPSTRSTWLVSTWLRARPARKRALASSVPIGPVKRASPPSRDTAIAALAAQPPAVAINVEACAFSPGCGKRSTWKMKSSTAMPAHSTTGRRPRALSELDAIFHPGADDVIRDGDRRGRGEAVWMLPGDHRGDLLAIEPARIGQLVAVYHDLMRDRLGVAADHQPGRKWPGLRAEIGDAPAHDAGFLARLSPHGVLDRFARLDKAGKARPHAGLKPMRAAENAAIARNGKHDGDRIGAREMRGLARRAVAP